MPLDVAMQTTDLIKFTPMGPEIYPLMAAPVPLMGTAVKMTVNNLMLCLEGDELPPSLIPPQPYMSGPFSIPGMGTVKILLAPNNLTVTTKEEGKKVLLKGTVFQAEFTVQTPAQQPTSTGTVPDPMPKHMLQCQFISMNMTVKFA